MTNTANDIQNRPIGVFDSGIGGVSVLRSLKQHLPAESFIYLGDMARVPYGTKSKETVLRYSMEAAQMLKQKHIKMLVIACNTVTALALTELRETLDIPVIGVIEPSARKACELSQSGRIALIATEATVASGEYLRAIQDYRKDSILFPKACGLLVALAEEGFLDHPLSEQAIEHYLTPFFEMSKENRPDCLILGCTHFPFLSQPIERFVGERMHVINSAEATAEMVKQWLVQHGMENTSREIRQTIQYFVTDAKPRFLRLARLFLNENIDETDILSVPCF